MNLDQYNPQDAPLTAEEQLQHDLRAAAINTPPPLADAPQDELRADLFQPLPPHKPNATGDVFEPLPPPAGGDPMDWQNAAGQQDTDKAPLDFGGDFGGTGELGDGGGEFNTGGGFNEERFLGRAMTNSPAQGNPSANPVIPQGHWGKRQPTDAGGMVRPWLEGPATQPQSQQQGQVATQDVMGNNVWEPANGFAATPAQDHVAHFHQHGGTPAAYEWDQAQRDRKAQQMGLAYDASHLSPAENDEITREAGMKFNNIPPGHHKQAAMARFINEATAARLRFKKEALHAVTARQTADTREERKMRAEEAIATRQEAKDLRKDTANEKRDAERHAWEREKQQWQRDEAMRKEQERRDQKQTIRRDFIVSSIRHHFDKLKSERDKWLTSPAGIVAQTKGEMLEKYSDDAMRAAAKKLAQQDLKDAKEIDPSLEGESAPATPAQPAAPATPQSPALAAAAEAAKKALAAAQARQPNTPQEGPPQPFGWAPQEPPH